MLSNQIDLQQKKQQHVNPAIKSSILYGLSVLCRAQYSGTLYQNAISKIVKSNKAYRNSN